MRIAIVALFIAFSASCALAQETQSEVLSGEVTASRPQVDFPFELDAGDVVTLTTMSDENFDTILTLTGPNGARLAQNDDMASGESLQSQIVHVATASGQYTASVTGYGNALGSFELEILHGIDFGLSDDARTIMEGVVTIDSARPTRNFTVDLAEDDIFVASTFALSDSLDTTLALLDADGNTIAQNDDRGDGTLNSHLIFQAPEAGRFQVQLGSWSGQDQGDAILSLAIDPNAEVPFDFSSIEGERIAAYADYLGADPESIEYPVTLTEGQTLYVMADTVEGDLDPVIRLEGPDGFPVALNDDRGDGSLNSAFAYTATEAGTYMLEISRYQGSDTGGQFELVLMSVDASVVETLQALLDNSIQLSGEVQSIRTDDFIVYYTLEGEDASSLEYAQSVAVALQEMLDIQVGRMGWAEPIRDNEGLYRAYVGDAGGSLGFTRPAQMVFDNPNTTDVREMAAARAIFLIENDFAGLGKAASPHSLMRATATHEFAHVIQYAYDAEEGLDWLYESTASWIEVATVGADQDATDYVSSDYDAPERCWTTSESGHNYSQWTLLQSLADVYGEDLIVRIWENTVELDGFETVAAALREEGTTIPDVIERWRAQNLALDYELAPLFNSTVALQRTLSQAGSWNAKGGLEQLGANYFTVDLDGRFTVTLDGESGIEVLALGVRDGEMHVVPLGQSGAIDTAGWDYLGLMVFNANMPEEPGACSGSGYTLDVQPSNAAMARAAYRFDARHFIAPGQE
ncbi:MULTISPECIES: DVUA0089 family protein [Hyphobacterium]|uniref:DVUA0089 family protein n=1 Tax=Hyphobacterium vulgare TaxID=1736751 RepID=A0ABV7A174_9PROT